MGPGLEVKIQAGAGRVTEDAGLAKGLQAGVCRAKDLDQLLSRKRMGLGWVQRPGL